MEYMALYCLPGWRWWSHDVYVICSSDVLLHWEGIMSLACDTFFPQKKKKAKGERRGYSTSRSCLCRKCVRETGGLYFLFNQWPAVVHGINHDYLLVEVRRGGTLCSLWSVSQSTLSSLLIYYAIEHKILRCWKETGSVLVLWIHQCSLMRTSNETHHEQNLIILCNLQLL